ncbi:hypothetical protein BST61_g8879 [Cercospora zeina]
MTLHLNLPGAHHRNAEQQADLREARRLLKDKVRNDWAYPPLPAWKSSGRGETATPTQEVEDRIAGFRFHTPAALERTNGVVGEALGLDFEPSEWRERDVSECSDTEAEGQTMSTSTPASARKVAMSKENVYKFDGPDSVGTQVNDHRLARKRKRHQALQDEMKWNDGLAHWTRRRDVWCCARGSQETTKKKKKKKQRPSKQGQRLRDPSTPGSSPSATPDAAVPTTTSASKISLDVLVPIAPPLLPNHPVRRRITTSMYPEIYNKIILQSRTPSVPINLLTLIHALVQGWKSDGEWPPKIGPLEKSIGRKKGAGAGHEGSLRQGVMAVGRVLRLTSVNEHG